MADRNTDRDRQMRRAQNDNDWDWDYYYEYRYIPYSPYRRNDYDRNFFDRDYDREYYSGNDWDYSYYPTSPYGTRSYGRYSGVGPRGYQRSDDRIKEDVNDRLTWHGYIDASDIDVGVDDGVVTLKGTVEDRRQKRLAEDIADGVSGVQDVQNQLSVRNRNRDQMYSQSGSGMGMSNRQVRPGMEVIGRDGDNVGEVKDVRANDFLVDRSLARDVYIPMSASQISDGQIRLNVRADEVDNQGWEMPDLFETEDETPSRSQKKR